MEPRSSVFRADSLLSEPLGKRSQIGTTECLQGGVGDPALEGLYQRSGLTNSPGGCAAEAKSWTDTRWCVPWKGHQNDTGIGKLGMSAEQWLV